MTAPGLEPLCLRELEALALEAQGAEAIPGGVAFRGKLADCYLANLSLRTAGRVLLRVAAFRAAGHREFKKHLAQIPWELYLHPGTRTDIRAAAARCRLHRTDDIAAHVARSLSDALGMPLPAEPGADPQAVFVRGENDRFTLSIDSSGALLYRRGVKVHKGRAPLRETLAAAVLSMAGWGPETVLADPMCGSGSFSLEAAMAAKGIPPGWFRNFAFQNWPSFAERRWNHLRNECGRRMAVLPAPLVFASDIDPRACLDLGECLKRHGLDDAARTAEGDFFAIDPRRAYPGPGLVVLNPPYGRRLETPAQVENLYRRIGAKLAADFKGWRAAVLFPDKRLEKLLPVKGATHRLLHGGLALGLAVGRI